MINTAPNSPFKGYYPNVNPFGISPRYNPTSMDMMYKNITSNDINTSIKPIDEDKANIEAEKDEVLLTFKPTGLALHNIKGKPHSKGGTPLNVPEGSFIFSNDKDMSLSKEEINTFKLGSYQKGGLIKNTPAAVLKRAINLNHNNRMVDTLQNSKNSAEKTTAIKMLEKYQKTIGNIAALQEIRKDVDIPPFATLITDSPEVKLQKENQKQFSKGGFYYNGGSVNINNILNWMRQGKLEGIDQAANYGQFGKTNIASNTPTWFAPMSAPEENKFSPSWFAPMSAPEENKFSPLGQFGQTNIASNTPTWFAPMSAPEEKNFSPLGEYANNSYESMTEDNIPQDDLSWIKPYNWNPKMMSMMGNIAQSPRSLYPSLALQTPFRMRGQSIDAQPGINSALASAYASKKALQQYAMPNQQNYQMIDSQSNKMAQDYSRSIEQTNAQNFTNVNNQNAQISNQALNNNNQQRAVYGDKLNELYQNVTDTRNAIHATNLNIMGEGLMENQNYNSNIDMLKRYQPWNVQSKMTQKTMEDLKNEFNRLTAGVSDEQLKFYIAKSLFGPYMKQPIDNMNQVAAMRQLFPLQ
jgi:hypothetical protein